MLPRGAVRNVHFSADTSHAAAAAAAGHTLVLTYQVQPGTIVFHLRIDELGWWEEESSLLPEPTTAPTTPYQHHTKRPQPLTPQQPIPHQTPLAGPCDRSFGVHVARLARFPPDIIEAADKRVETLQVGAS